MRRQTLIVMVKEPVAGNVKTRLGRDIGMTNAAWWFRHQTRRLLRDVRDPRWDVVLSVSPDRAIASRTWPARFPRLAQGRGDLGQRMAGALAAFQGPVVLIGGDIPNVGRAQIATAFRVLGRAASVVGPATDGGFWLIGLRNGARRHPTLFFDVAWSAPDTLAKALPTLPKPVAFADEMQDVDTEEDLRRAISG